MLIRDMLLAILTSLIWGLGFVVAKFGLESFSPAQWTVLRFVICGLFAFAVPRPNLPWLSLIAIGSTLFAGQFILLFFALTHGMPPGLASVSQQIQAFFTVLLSAIFLRDLPHARQIVGMLIAFAGLTLIAATVGVDLHPLGLGLAVAAAFSWSIGNVLVKRAPKVPMISLVVWSSLVPPLPALIISYIYDQQSFMQSIADASWRSIAAGTVYSGLLGIVVAYAAWGYLLQKYPAAVVAPFALISPCVGVVAANLFYGETFNPIRFAGMALIFCGLVVIVLPLERLKMIVLTRPSR